MNGSTMLTKLQLHILAEQIMKANIEAGLQLDRIETPNNDKTKLVAKFTIGTARPFEWKLLSTGNKVFFVNDITRRGVNLILDSSMNIDSTSMEWIKSVVAKSTQTVFPLYRNYYSRPQHMQ